MPFEFHQIPVSGPSEAVAALNRTLAAGRIASIRKEFVVNGEQSFWAFCVETLEGPTPSKTQVSRTQKVDYKEVLSAEDFAVFSRLRDLRKELAEKEAIPAYSIFTNEQLACMVTDRVQNLTEMGRIEGVGEARLKKYGEAFVARMAEKGGRST